MISDKPLMFHINREQFNSFAAIPADSQYSLLINYVLVLSFSPDYILSFEVIYPNS